MPIIREDQLQNLWSDYIISLQNIKKAAQKANAKYADIKSSIAEQSSYKYTNAQIDVVKTQILLKVEQSDIDLAKNELGKVIDTKVNTAKSEIKITTDKIAQNISNITTTVNNKADGSTVTAMSNKIGSLETSINGIKGEVSSLETTTSTISSVANSALTNANKGITDAKVASDKAVAAQSTANSAKTDASNAQSTANSAKTEADSANSKLADISNDNKLTATEKQNVKLEWDKIVGEKDKVIADANKYGQSTTDYTNKYNALNTYITPLLSSLTTTSDIVGTTFRTNFTNYYNSKQDLLNLISSKAKQLSDQAQSDATKANSQANANKVNLTTLTTEVTTVKSNVATLDVNLKGITQRVSSTENVTTTLTTKVNKAQTDANTANNKVDGLEIGGVNLLINTDYRQARVTENPPWDATKNGKLTADYWGGYNAGVSNAAQGYHAHLYEGGKFNFKTFRFVCEDITRWLGSSQALKKGSIQKGKTYTFSVDLYSENRKLNDVAIYGGVYSYKVGATGQAFNSGQFYFRIEKNDEWKRYTFTFVADKDLDETRDLAFYVYGYSSLGTSYIKNAKLEEGNVATAGSLSPDDTQRQLDSNKTEITTTNNKVSLIEANLGSITSRVSNVETNQTTVGGKLTALETWKKSAEQKITDASIISTVSSQFYKKSETDSKYASQTQIAQLDNKIALKVDVNGVKSTIEQNPTSVKIGFNKINNSIQFTEGEMQINVNNRKSLTLKSGRLNAYDTSTGRVLGYVGQTYTDVNGLRCPGQVFGSGYHSYYTIFGLDANWDSDDKQTGTNFDAFINICYFNYKDLQRGIYFNKPVNFNDSAPIEAQKINIKHSITAAYNNTMIIGDMTNALYRVFTNGIRSKTYDLELLAGNATYGSLNVTESGYFHPQNNAGYSLGTDVKRFHTLYVANPVSVSSDRNLKDDIEYLVSQNNSTISTSDMYYFIKDELKLASYNYKSSKIRNEIIDMKKNIGFIAQDLEGSKVGEEIIRRGRDGILSYDSGNYQNVLAGALKEALNKIDILERKLSVLENVAS